MVVLSDMARKPDWLFPHNIKHFTKAVAERIALRIAILAEFFHAFSRCFADADRQSIQE
jgi:hypothetical protein